jgi:hypothetical protein
MAIASFTSKEAAILFADARANQTEAYAYVYQYPGQPNTYHVGGLECWIPVYEAIPMRFHSCKTCDRTGSAFAEWQRKLRERAKTDLNAALQLAQEEEF